VKLYDRKNALVAADLLNDRVLPFFEEQNVPLLRVLTDRGTEYCGNRECHEYQLYLAVENIDHSRTKAKSPQTVASASASIAPCKKSSIVSHFAKGSNACSTPQLCVDRPLRLGFNISLRPSGCVLIPRVDVFGNLTLL
jgi:hypothetical protein